MTFNRLTLFAWAAENAQLEEMLSHADAAAQGGSGEISRLEDELARAQVGAGPFQFALVGKIVFSGMHCTVAESQQARPFHLLV